MLPNDPKKVMYINYIKVFIIVLQTLASDFCSYYQKINSKVLLKATIIVHFTQFQHFTSKKILSFFLFNFDLRYKDNQIVTTFFFRLISLMSLHLLHKILDLTIIWLRVLQMISREQRYLTKPNTLPEFYHIH